MQVTPEMTEGYNGRQLSLDADIITQDETGIAVRTAEIGDLARLTLDSLCVTGSKTACLSADECDELAGLLRAKANELRGGVR